MMKLTRLFVVLSVLCCMLLACERLSPDQKDELKLKSEEFATFLNDN